MPLDNALRIEIAPYAVEMAAAAARYKVAWGGRGSAKTESVARILVAEAFTSKQFVGCFREYQSSIRDSVHSVLTRTIDGMGLRPWWRITDHAISCPLTGSQFIFKGLHHDILEIKGLHGLTRGWVEEAQSCSKMSLQILGPTFRAKGSQIYVTFNQMDETDPVYHEFVTKQPHNAIVKAVTWEDNPWFHDSELPTEREYCLGNDPDNYDWIWGTDLRKIAEAAIFKGKVVVRSFEEPPAGTRLFYGVDWGFSNDPTFGVRCWVNEPTNELMIDHESVGYKTELEDLPALLEGGKASDGRWYPGLPGVREWPLKGDASRPETISYVRRKGFNCTAAEKWPGSVQDGVEHIRGFRNVVIHDRCKNLQREARLYSYKIDPKQVDNEGKPVVLPIIVDAWNHGWDGTRYSLDGYIQKRGKTRWEQLNL